MSAQKHKGQAEESWDWRSRGTEERQGKKMRRSGRTDVMEYVDVASPDTGSFGISFKKQLSLPSHLPSG